MTILLLILINKAIAHSFYDEETYGLRCIDGGINSCEEMQQFYDDDREDSTYDPEEEITYNEFV